MPTVRTNDITTYYERRGSGPPVVFVHGAILNHSQWDAQADALADEYTTIAYDVRGHGRTGGSARRRYSVELFADDLHALLDELDVERPVLCGLSLGGCVAQAYAAAHPENVAGLALVGTFGRPFLTRGEWLQRSVLLRASVLPVRLFGYERVERLMVRTQELIQGQGVSGNYDNVVSLRDEGPRMETDEFAKVVRALAGFRGDPLDFSGVTAPVRVLYGEHEPAFVRRHATALVAGFPDATVRVVPGAGHASNLDNPDFVTGALRELLAEATADD